MYVPERKVENFAFVAEVLLYFPTMIDTETKVQVKSTTNKNQVIFTSVLKS